jgi:hypothetical protein
MNLQTSPQDRIREDRSILLIDNTGKHDGVISHKRFLRGNGKEVVNQLASSEPLDRVTIQIFRTNPNQLYAEIEKEAKIEEQVEIARKANNAYDLIRAANRQAMLAAGVDAELVEKICHNTLVILQEKHPEQVEALLSNIPGKS